ncbi:MAG: hypothetical protein ACYTHK_03780 [Planctomycetota bacterium]|jgi:hypothetical protein
MRTLAAALLLAAAVHAQQQPIPVHFDNGSIDIMPGITNPQRYQLKQWLRAPLKRLADLDRRVAKINQELRSEKNEDKRAKLVAERKKLQGQRPAMRKHAREQFDKIGISRAQLDRLNAIPKGELRRERYNHAVMLEAPALSPKQTALVRACIAATDSAQLTLALQRRDVKRNLADQDEKVRRRVSNDLNNRIRAIEKRFWVAMYYVLTPEQMRATKEIRSPRYQRVGDHRNHLYMLPGLSAVQASRINSLLNELQSETAADDAVIRTLRRKLGQKGLDGAERKELQNQLNDAYGRRGRIYRENYQAVRDLMSDEQEAAWNAIPPQLAGGDVGRGVMSNLNGIVLRPEQGDPMRKLGGAAQKQIQAKQRAMREGSKELRESGMGADSPQMMMMSTMQRGVQGDRARILRKLGHQFCTEIFEPEQLAAWLATGSARP